MKEGRWVDLFLQLTEIDPNWVRTESRVNVALHQVFGSAELEDFAHQSLVSISAQKTIVRVRVHATQDQLVEGPESGSVCIHGIGGSYSYNAAQRCVTVNITDDDYAIVSVTGGATTRSVTEGGALELEVTIDKTPARTVSLSVSASSGSATESIDYTLAAPAINFSPTQATSWKVRLQSIEDVIAEGNEGLSINFGLHTSFSHMADSVLIETKAVPVTIEDDDTAVLTLTGPSEPVVEGSTATLTARLSNPMQKAFSLHWWVSASINSAHKDLASYSDLQGVNLLSTFTLDFAAGETEKTLTVGTVDDSEVEARESFVVQMKEVGTLPSFDRGTVFTSGATVTIKDNDVPLLDVYPPDARVYEGIVVWVSALLTEPPLEPVSVSWWTEDIEGGAVAGLDYTPQAPTTLTYTAGGPRNQLVNVRTTADTDTTESDESFNIMFASDDVRLSTNTVQVTITPGDPSRPVVAILPPPEPVVEGNSTDFTLFLTHAVDTELRVNSAPFDGTANATDYMGANDPISATIRAGEQRATVTVQTTQDTIVEGNETFNVILQTLSGDVGIAGRSIGALAETTILDDDTAIVSLSGPEEPVSEGETAVFTVTLSAALDTELTFYAITVLGGQSPAGLSDFEASVPLLTFSAGETTKTFSVQTTEDTIVEADESFLVNLSSLSAVPTGVKAGVISVPVTIKDDDTVAVSIADATVAEANGIAQPRVTLSNPAEREVTLSYATSDGSATAALDYEAATGTITIPTGATWWPIVLKVIDDATYEVAETFTVTLSNPQPSDQVRLSDAAATLTISDDENKPTARLFVTPAAVIEDDGSSTVSAELSAPVGEAVTLTVSAAAVSPAESEDFIQSGTTLTIPAGATESSGTVTLTPVDNEVVGPLPVKKVTVSSSVAGGLGVSAPSSRTLWIIDDDSHGATVTPTNLTVAEGSTGTYTVVLDALPTADVTVSVSGTAGDVSVDKSALTFTTSNWGTAQTVTVSASEDADRVADAAVTLTHTADGGEYGSVTIDSVEVTVRDNDLVTPAALAVTEGATGTYTVVLDRQPSEDVTVSVSGAAEDVTVDNSVLTFTDSNWGTAQTVTVSAGEDDDRTADAAVTLAHNASGGGYGSVTFGSVTVAVRDNDLVVPAALTVTEGSTGTYTVVLDRQPSAAVTVTVGGASGDLSVDKSSLTFTTSDWGTVQSVTVSAGEDDDAATDDAVTLAHSASGGGFATVAFGSVAVSVTENDTAGATVTPGALTVTEGSSGTYTVVLGTEPTADVTVSVSGASGDVSVDKSSLTFTDSDWGTAQTVTVSAAEDDDRAADAAVTLAHSASGGGYGSVTFGSVAVTVRDNDLVVPGTLTVTEGSTGTYSVVLDTQPSAAVTVTVGGTSGDVSVDKDTLTFTTTDWGTAQTVTVSAAEDDDAATDDAVTLTHSASGGGFGTVAFGSVAVSIGVHHRKRHGRGDGADLHGLGRREP